MGLIRRRRRLWASAAARRVVAAADKASTPEEAIVFIAQKLLDGVSCPPTDLNTLAARLKVCGFRPEQLPVAGELRRKDSDHFEIVYASGMQLGRRRFTIAHELGHAFFEQTGPGCPRSGDELETLCDMLAAEFLMPRHLAEPRIPKRPTTQDILNTTKVFEVSVHAAVQRCRELRGLHAVGLNQDGRLSFTTGLVREIDTELLNLTAPLWKGQKVEGELYIEARNSHVRYWRLEGVRVGSSRLGLCTIWPAEDRRFQQSMLRADR